MKKKIGVVVAIEIDSVLAKYGAPSETINRHGYAVRTFVGDRFDLYVVDSGAGEISATAATQELISTYGVDLILNFGVVGALTPEMSVASLCVVERVVHHAYDTTGWVNLPRGQYPGQESPYFATTPELVEKAIAVCPSLKRVTCASADQFIDRPEDKQALHEQFDADICEMEAAGIVITCRKNGVPCLLIKAISDSLIGGGKEFFTELTRASALCFDTLDQVIREIF